MFHLCIRLAVMALKTRPEPLQAAIEASHPVVVDYIKKLESEITKLQVKNVSQYGTLAGYKKELEKCRKELSSVKKSLADSGRIVISTHNT